jgi:VIT1/CCC1 family predicted Fe2+/Mn2+ transporter
MKEQKEEQRAPVLDPVSRISEIVFGVLMALSFTGALNAATAGREEVRTMMLTAIGCNLAWGLVDAVMYIIATLTERGRNLTLLHQVRSAVDPRTAQAVISETLPGRLPEAIGPDGLEDMRRRLVALEHVPTRARVHREDFAGAIGVFLLVVLSTFPVVVPFMFLSRLDLAMRVSNGIALVILSVGGYQLGRFAGGNPWRTGLGMAALGAVLVSIIMALGG